MTTVDMTRTCQHAAASGTENDEFTSAGLVAALEQAWAAIRTRHPDVPAAVIVIGSGSPSKPGQGMRWGHFASLRWQAGNRQLPEILVSGEGLNRPAVEVMTTLLHEAAHGIADTRGVKDTSRQGRWHNAKFAAHARELGLQPTKDPKLGWSRCTLTDAAAVAYQPVMAALADALRAYRHPEPAGEAKNRSNSNNGLALSCACPRRIRVAASVLETGPVTCGVCDADFLPDDTDREEHTVRTRDLDPTGEHHHGIPTYPYRCAPADLATRRQLRRRGLRPGGQDLAGQIVWRKGKRIAHLYRVDLALPKRTATPAQLAAIDRALLARRTCPTCRSLKDYYIPRRHGECLDCAPAGAR